MWQTLWQGILVFVVSITKVINLTNRSKKILIQLMTKNTEYTADPIINEFNAQAHKALHFLVWNGMDRLLVTVRVDIVCFVSDIKNAFNKMHTGSFVHLRTHEDFLEEVKHQDYQGLKVVRLLWIKIKL